MPRKVSLFLMCVTAVALLSSPVLGAAFVKYDGVDGESTDRDHSKWSDLLDVEHAFLIPSPASDGKKIKARDVLAPTLGPFTIKKSIDKAGGKIAEALLRGRIFPRVEIELTATYGGARATYLRYELTNVMITSYQLNASGNDEGPVTELIDMDFQAVKVTYTEYDNEGGVLGNVEYEYDKREGQ